MLQDTINKLEKIIAESKHLTPERQQELEALVKELHTELAELEKTQKEQANSIAEHAERLAQESLHEEQDEERLAVSVGGLKAAIREFEASHPNLTRIINSICVAFEV